MKEKEIQSSWLVMKIQCKTLKFYVTYMHHMFRKCACLPDTNTQIAISTLKGSQNNKFRARKAELLTAEMRYAPQGCCPTLYKAGL